MKITVLATVVRAIVLAFGVLLLGISSVALAQTSNLPPTLDCIEVVHAEANEALTNYTNKRQGMKLSFARETSGDYSMIGNLGSAGLVTVTVPGDDFVQFLERTPAGTLNMTTILTKPDGGSYKAVHSRHTIIVGELVPSQYLLSCRAR